MLLKKYMLNVLLERSSTSWV